MWRRKTAWLSTPPQREKQTTPHRQWQLNNRIATSWLRVTYYPHRWWNVAILFSTFICHLCHHMRDWCAP
jgi:hypothetical protein